ncbi:MAG: PEGA domain-containing protein [Myxococcota bacterium]
MLMMKRFCIGVVLLTVSSASWAQDDDDLVPLGPVPTKKPAAKPRPKPKPKPAPVKKPTTTSSDDDDLVPIGPAIAKGDVSIKLASPLSGAVLSIDGKEIGTLPLAPQSVQSGEHTVTVKRPGYAAFVKKVLVQGGKSVEIEAKLIAVAAVLSVESDVPGAQVLLNGRPIGIAPLTDVEVPPGPAEVAVIKEGFREDAQKITFVAGRDYPVVVKFNAVASKTLTASDRPVQTNLVPGDTGTSGPLTSVKSADEPITGKWYFWAGIAAGVVAIGVGTAVGVSAASPKALRPEDVCGGPCDGSIGFGFQRNAGIPFP